MEASKQEQLDVIRHSTAHLMAQAIKRLYGEVKFGVGPVIEHGFYYDFDMQVKLSVEDLPRIEEEMRSIVRENLPIKRLSVSREEAERRFHELGDELKLELLSSIPEDEEITLYEQGEFVDLCRGPHMESTGCLGVFQLMSIAGAYWRGDSRNRMLQRIYGTAFLSRQELNAHMRALEEAEKRDHRKLGKQLELFMFSEEAPGMPFYLPKGQIVRQELEAALRELQTKRYGYEEVRTPFMMNQQLWENSGHWEHYGENMYFTKVDEHKFALKPMNCPGHMLIFKSKLRSYRDLPLRLAEFGQVHRHEFSGALNGMLRVRTFCQDDAHLFVTPDQIQSEIRSIISMVDEMYAIFGFTYEVELSTRPEHAMGSDEEWDQAENALRSVLEESGQAYSINEGDGAFYGPKIDFHIKDAIGRSHQCATVQLDFQMPIQFELSYIDERNERVHPVVIHRAIYGSIDRFFGILIEHYGGAFPVWLAPRQVKVIPVAEAHLSYADDICEALKAAGVRAKADSRKEKLGYKMREAQLEKVPYIVVDGDKEQEEQSVAVRKRGESRNESLRLEQLLARVKEDIATKR